MWLLGFAFMVASFLMQAVALHLGDLSVVQPILTTELLFLVVLLATWFRFRIGLREWLGCVAAAGGLAGFLIFAQPGGGNLSPSNLGWAVAGSICGGAVVLAVVLALRGPRWWRAAMFGAAGAIGFAFTAALIKRVGDYVVGDWTHMFAHWETYALALCGVGSVFLAQNAFHAGPIAASQTALVLVDPLASMAIGIGLFGDNLRTAGALRSPRGPVPPHHVRRGRLRGPVPPGLGHEGRRPAVHRDALAALALRSGWPTRCRTPSPPTSTTTCLPTSSSTCPPSEPAPPRVVRAVLPGESGAAPIMLHNVHFRTTLR